MFKLPLIGSCYLMMAASALAGTICNSQTPGLPELPSSARETFESCDVPDGFQGLLAGGALMTAVGSEWHVSDTDTYDLGINFTPGGTKYLRIFSDDEADRAYVRIDFPALVYSFNVRLAGVGNNDGVLYAIFPDLSLQIEHTVSYSNAAGFDSVVFEMMRSERGHRYDVYGMDEIRYSYVAGIPEPANWKLFASGMALIGGLGWFVRQRNARNRLVQ